MAKDSSSSFPAASSILATLGAVVTFLAVALTALYFSGQADDLFIWAAKKYYKAEAKAEITAMKTAGEGALEGLVKDRLKQNPIMGEKELDEVSSGLGSEAAQQGLTDVEGKLGSKLAGLGGFGKD